MKQPQNGKSGFYKTTDLFGNETIHFCKKKSFKPDLFNNYDDFVSKFEPKKTTDDCITPTDVYQIVLNHVHEKCNLQGKQIIRPFFPGGDYENIDYPDNAVVIDNPPFSIITQICRYYINNSIQFFLFAPHLTAFTA